MTDSPKKGGSFNSAHSLNEIFPKASTLFSLSAVSANNLVANGLIVLDTNALLAPYSLQTQQLADIEKVLKPIIDAGRLFIPGQVAREFVKHRAEKLKDIHSHLTTTRSGTLTSIPDSPLLRAHDEYKRLELADTELKNAVKARNKVLDELLAIVKGWTWTDPVSELYRRIGLDQLIIEPEESLSDIVTEMNRRNNLKIPPGYKDSGKEDNSCGDLLIWHSVLRLAKEKKKDLLFVSGDQKNDWWHQSSGQALYPRFELLYEFNTCSEGKCLQLTTYSDFLKMVGASQQIIETVASVEMIAQQESEAPIVEDYSRSDTAKEAAAPKKESELVDNTSNKDLEDLPTSLTDKPKGS